MESWLLLLRGRWGCPTGQILASSTGAHGGSIMCVCSIPTTAVLPISSAKGVLSLVASELVFAPGPSLAPSPSARSTSWAPMDSQSPMAAAPALLLSCWRCSMHPRCLALGSRVVAKPGEASRPLRGIRGGWGLGAGPAVPCVQGPGQVPSWES